MAFAGVTNAHGPSPQTTACRSPSCSLTTATGSYQVQSNLLCQNFISFSLNNSFNSKSQNWEYFCWAFLLLLSRSKGCNMFDLSVTALFYSVYIHVGKLGFIICMHWMYMYKKVIRYLLLYNRSVTWRQWWVNFIWCITMFFYSMYILFDV